MRGTFRTVITAFVAIALVAAASYPTAAQLRPGDFYIPGTLYAPAGMQVGPTAITDNLTISGPRPWIDVRAKGAKGDGVTDDTAAIQAAINSAPSTGADIFISSGNYQSSATVNLKSGIRIICSGRLTVLKPSVALSNGIFNGNAITDVSIQNCVLDGGNLTGGVGISIGGSTRVLIQNNYLRHFTNEAILNNTNTDVVVFANTVEDAGPSQSAAIWGANNVRARVIGNTVDNTGHTATAAGAITMGGTTNLAVNANTLKNCTNSGVDVGGSVNATVTNNVVQGCTNGIWLEAGVASQGIVVSNNFVTGPNTAGIGIAAAGVLATLSRTVIATNNISGFSIGILLDGSNIDFVISNNYIEQTGQQGIWVRDGTLGRGTQIIITGNHVRDGAQNAIAQGIALRGDTDIDISLNRVSGTLFQFGIREDDGAFAGNISANIIISNNDVRGNVGSILLNGSGANRLAYTNVGFNPQPATTITAGASVWTYTNNDGYPEFMTVITNPGNISALSWKGQALVYSATAPPTLSLQPADTMTVTWATTAPVFFKVPQ